MGRCMVLLLIGLARLSAQIMDQTLLDDGNRASSQGNYVDAWAHFFAYYSRYPIGMQLDPSHARQVNEAMSAARNRLVAAIDELNRLRSSGGLGTGSYGLGPPPPHVDSASLQGPQTRSMICQGGGNLWFGLQPKSYGVMMFVIRFRAAAGAGQDALQPGECTWFDRKLDPSEPNAICHSVSAANLAIQWTTNEQIPTLNSNTAPYLSDLVRSGSYYKFAVFNNGQGCLVATSVPQRQRISAPPSR